MYIAPLVFVIASAALAIAAPTPDPRIGTTFPTHDHADRGQFTLAALGRAWACDGYRDTESKFHNVVTIDGRGQGQ